MIRLDKENGIVIIRLGPSSGPWTKLNTRESLLYKDGTTEGDLSEKEILQEFYKAKLQEVYDWKPYYGYGSKE